MNTDQQIKKFIETMAEIYPGTTTATKAQVFFTLLKPDLVSADLNKLLKKVADNYEFFPSIKQIKDSLGVTEVSPRTLATEFVDKMIALFQSNVNVYQEVGGVNYNFWKNTVGVIRHDLVSIDPKFHRTNWIDRIEAAYLKHSSEIGPLNLLGVSEGPQALSQSTTEARDV